MKKLYFTTVLFLFLSQLQAQWTEISKTLPIPYLKNYEDNFGKSVSIDGNYAVVGAPQGNFNKGCAYILYNNGTNWETVAQLTASDGESYGDIGSFFGHSVSISGNNVLIGAALIDVNGSLRGASYIFEKPATGWADMTETAKLTASDDAGSFSSSVSISGNYALIGASGDDDNGDNSGSAYIFEKPVTGWVDMTETAKLTATDGTTNDYFGSSVSISGDYVLIGAYGDDDNGDISGSAYIFEKPVTGWVDMTETGKLTASDGGVGDYFGGSVCIFGDYTVIGAYGNRAAYIFEKPATGWADIGQEIAKLTASGVYSGLFGSNISISGDYVLIGDRWDDDNGSNSGAAYIFEKPATGWVDMTETAKLTASDGEVDDYFGASVCISGNYVVIGAFQDDDNGYLTGSTYIFEKPATGWAISNENQKILPTPYLQNAKDHYGKSVSIDGNYAAVLANNYAYVLHHNGTDWETIAQLTIPSELCRSVCISGDYIVIGDYADDEISMNSGAVYVFEKPANGWTNSDDQIKLTASSLDTYDQFGYSVSISGNHIVVGAYGDDDKGANAGAAYIFEKDDNGWTEIAKLTASDGEDHDYFGNSVSISGDYVIIGAYEDDNTEYNSGSAYIFEKPASGWTDMTETDKLTHWVFGFEDYFGSSVSISGNYAIIGAPGKLNNSDSYGEAFIFEKTDNGWSKKARLISTDRSAGDNFGSSVCISGDIAIIGAHRAGLYWGSAYIYIKPTSGWEDMTQTLQLTTSDRSSEDFFASSVSISSQYALIGTPGDDDNGSSSGSVYIFMNQNNAPTVENPIDDIIENEGYGNTSIDLSNVFTDVDGDNLSYSVASSNTSIATVSLNESTLTITEAGTGTTEIIVTAKDNNGGTADDVFTITVNTVPIVVNPIDDITQNEGFGSTTIDLSNVFTDEDGDDLSYSAESSNTSIATVSLNESTLTITESGSGTSDITVTADDNKGGTVDDMFTLTINSTSSFQQLEKYGIKIYPNPVKESLNFEFGENNIEKLTILDILGKKLIEKQNLQQKETIDLTDFEKGIYIISIQVGNETLTNKIIKE